MKTTVKHTVIATELQLELLFPDEVQRTIFISIMNKLIEIINERTIHTPFICAERIS